MVVLVVCDKDDDVPGKAVCVFGRKKVVLLEALLIVEISDKENDETARRRWYWYNRYVTYDYIVLSSLI